MIKEIKLPSYFRMYPNVFNEHQTNSFYEYFPEMQLSAGRLNVQLLNRYKTSFILYIEYVLNTGEYW